MKSIALFSVILLFALAGCKQEEANPIEGAWNLIYTRQIVNDSVISEFPTTFQGKDMKMWTKEHWSFVSRYQLDTAYFDYYGGGTYTINGNVYVENIVYHTAKDLVGQSIKMLMTVKNDTLIQIWPMNDQGEIDKGNCTVEKYTKLK